MLLYTKLVRTAFFSLVFSLFLVSGVQSSFSQTDDEESNDLSIGKLLEIKGDPVSSGTTNYQVIVTGQISLGPNANPNDLLSPDGTTIDGTILPTGLDNFFFTGDIISITADQHIFSFVDGELFKELSEEDLRLIEEYLEQARILFTQKYTDSSIFHYDKVLVIDPLNINALNGKAIVLDFVGSHEEAILHFDKVLVIDSKNVDALLGKGFALDSLGKPEEAASYFEQVLEPEEIEQVLEPEEIEQVLEPEEIQQPLQEISEESLELLQEFFEQAQELLEEENFEDAISFYDMVLEIDSSDIDALNGKALALASIGNHEEAISFYDMVLEIDSSDVDALFGKAFSLESLNRTEESLSIIEKVETLITPEVEFRTPAEPQNEEVSEEIAGIDQTLFVIIGIFIIILLIIITIDFFRRKRKTF